MRLAQTRDEQNLGQAWALDRQSSIVAVGCSLPTPRCATALVLRLRAHAQHLIDDLNCGISLPIAEKIVTMIRAGR